MTTYTLIEARAKLAEVFPERAYTLTDDEMRKVAKVFGLTLEEPTLKPGIYLHDDGTVIEVCSPACKPVLSTWEGSRLLTENPGRLTPARVVTDAEWSALVALRDAVDTIKATGGSVEIHGVKITPCDEYGQTEGAARPADGAPVELTPEQIEELWNAALDQKTHDSVFVASWSGLSNTLRNFITDTVNAALREHGHGAALPSRDRVRQAIKDKLLERFHGFSVATVDCATDAVMALIPEGGKA